MPPEISTSPPMTTPETDGLLLGSLEEGLALCLSGGGYRAMLFHLGTLWRLNELGYLPKLDRISSVSGGPTRLAALPSERKDQLINWGYAVCDAAMRKHVDPALPAPADFPYSASGV